MSVLGWLLFFLFFGGSGKDKIQARIEGQKKRCIAGPMTRNQLNKNLSLIVLLENSRNFPLQDIVLNWSIHTNSYILTIIYSCAGEAI